MIEFCLLDREGTVLKKQEDAQEIVTVLDRVYLEGDRMVIRADARFLSVQLDQSIPPATVCLPEGTMTWKVPCGEERSAYAPGLFEQTRHIICIRRLDAPMKDTDLACNPLDLRGDTDFFPHAFANIETRNEACFAARNLIDGLSCNAGHGEWPYQSWGIGTREDAACWIDLGRKVRAGKIGIVLRADFPHDAWFSSVRITLDDGTEQVLELRKTAKEQVFTLPDGCATRKIQIDHLVKAPDPSPFPSFRSVRLYGEELIENA
ncbi:MAG: hypothetical protein IJ083_09790 [Clostridia bacterium]|nr:hypothetical protein [Clostridia bacterium]